MSSIDKLLIRGVRSFSTQNESTIDFSGPLTIIVGSNGAGKTTIIECLKYATTGELPPQSRGGAFVRDPALERTTQVKAQVRLGFQSVLRSNQQMVCTRALQCTRRKATATQPDRLECKTLESCLSRIDPVTGEQHSISTRVGEMDLAITQHLGVSRALLDSVVFCHQEEALWPLSEPSALKKRFDDIFAATQYTRALDNLKSLRKNMLVQLKLDEQRLAFVRSAMERGAKLHAQREVCHQKCREIIVEIEVLAQDIERDGQERTVLNDRMVQLSKLAQSISQCTQERQLDYQSLCQLLDLYDQQVNVEKDAIVALVDGRTDDEIEEALKALTGARNADEKLVELKKQQEQVDVDLKSLDERLMTIRIKEEQNNFSLKESSSLVTQMQQLGASLIDKESAADLTMLALKERAALMLEDLRAKLQTVEVEYSQLQMKHWKEMQAVQDELDEATSALSRRVDELDVVCKSISEFKHLEQDPTSELGKHVCGNDGDSDSSLFCQACDNHLCASEGEHVDHLSQLTADGSRLEKESSQFNEQMQMVMQRVSHVGRNTALLTRMRIHRKDCHVAFENMLSNVCTLKLHLENHADMDPLHQVIQMSDLDALINVKDPCGSDLMLEQMSDSNSVWNSERFITLWTATINGCTIALKEAVVELREFEENVKQASKSMATIEAGITQARLQRDERSVELQRLKSVMSGQIANIQTAGIVPDGDDELNLVDWELQLQMVEQKLQETNLLLTGSFENNIDILRHFSLLEDKECPVCDREFSSTQEHQSYKQRLDELQTTLPTRISSVQSEISVLQADILIIRRLVTQTETMRSLQTDIDSANAYLERSEQVDFPQYQQAMQAASEAVQTQSAVVSIFEESISLCSALLKSMQNVSDAEVLLRSECVDECKDHVALWQKLEKEQAALSDLQTQQSQIEEQWKQCKLEMSLKQKEKNEVQEQLSDLRLQMQSRSELRAAHLDFVDAKKKAVELEQEIETLKSTAQQCSDRQSSIRMEQEKQQSVMMQQKSALVAEQRAFEERSSQLTSLYDRWSAINPRVQLIELEESDQLIMERNGLMEKRSTLLQTAAQVREMIATHDQGAAEQAIAERRLRNVLHSRQLVSRIFQHDAKLSELKDQASLLGHQGDMQAINSALQKELDAISSRVAEKQGERAGLLGTLRALESQISELTVELDREYSSVNDEYMQQHVRTAASQCAIDDVEQYAKALDQAIVRFHTEKMRQVNRIIREIWTATYRGTDIDAIEIRADYGNASKNIEEEDEDGADDENAGTATDENAAPNARARQRKKKPVVATATTAATSSSGRNCNYRVVMIKNGGDVELDMRGRSSAGQRVLASIVIRLALAEAFGQHCGMLALDEPTTNLDSDNVESLAISLAEIIKMRSGGGNFQLIIITHDEDFVESLGRQECADYYWRVSKNLEDQCSTITRESFQVGL